MTTVYYTPYDKALVIFSGGQSLMTNTYRYKQVYRSGGKGRRKRIKWVQT